MTDQSRSEDGPRPSRVLELLDGSDGKEIYDELFAMATKLIAKYPKIGKTPDDLVASTIKTALRREAAHEDGVDETKDIRQWLFRRMLTKKDQYKTQQEQAEKFWTPISDLQSPSSTGDAEPFEARIKQPERTDVDEARERVRKVVKKLARAEDVELREMGMLVLLGFNAVQIADMTELSPHQVRRRIGLLKAYLESEMD